MKTFLFKWVLVACILQCFGLSVSAAGIGLKAYHNVVLDESDINDGDSFFVKADGETLHLRLYFVDCPETVVFADHDARRVREQARYFGIDSAERVMWLGEQAADFTRAVLSQPFTVYTYYQKALGGANSQRIYGYVVTANGRDLGELLVENGFGRSFGVKSDTYNEMSIQDMLTRLGDLEASAMLGHRGIWSESNASKIVQYRAEQRAERQEIRKIMSSNVVLLESPVDINSASKYDLERIPGIGPVTAGRIIQNRPYAILEDLMSVHGIGTKTLEKMRPFIRVDTSATNS